jgi:probable rRNA maturation factor
MPKRISSPDLLNTNLQIEIQYASDAIKKTLTATASSGLMKKWVRASIQQGGLITLRFVNAAEGKSLNFQFRQKDQPTNVLTFPYELSEKAVLADIIFCLPVVQKEARAQKKPLQSHLAHLIIHGCLHAQGLDHESATEAKIMENREIALLKLFGFGNPYEAF